MDETILVRHREIEAALRATAKGLLAAPNWIKMMTVTADTRAGQVELMIASKSGEVPSLILRVLGHDLDYARYVLMTDEGMKIYDSEYDEGEYVSDSTIEIVAVFARSVSLMLLLSRKTQ